MKNKGFTLIELLVSIALIGVLSALSLALFQEFRIKAWDAAAIFDARNLYMSATIYGDENPNSSVYCCNGGTYAACTSCSTVLANSGFVSSPNVICIITIRSAVFDNLHTLACAHNRSRNVFGFNMVSAQHISQGFSSCLNFCPESGCTLNDLDDCMA